MLTNREVATGAGITTIVFFHNVAALGAWRCQRHIVARYGIAIVFFRALDDDLCHLSDLAHESHTLEFALLDLLELVFPFTRQFRRRQFLDIQSVEQGHQLSCLRGRHQITAFATQIAFVEQAFDDRSACRRCTESILGHSLTQLFVIHQLACAFHRRQQRAFVVACGRTC